MNRTNALVIAGRNALLFPGFLLMLVGLLGCQRGETPTASSGEKVKQELFGFTTRHVMDNVLQWTLKAESAVFLQPDSDHASASESDRIQVSRPEVLIYEDGRPTIKIRSDSGKIYEDVYDLEFTGNVIAVHGDVTVYTEEMHWMNERGSILAPGRVKMVRGNSVMYGRALSADPKLKKVHMLDIESRLYPKDEHAYVPIQ